MSDDDNESEEPKPNRNPLIFPTASPEAQPQGRRRTCPKCECPDFGGRKVQGVITFTCNKCKNQWSGGLGDAPDPSRPTPPMNPADRPAVEFYRTEEGGDRIFQSINRRNPNQAFRQGSLIPDEGDE